MTNKELIKRKLKNNGKFYTFLYHIKVLQLKVEERRINNFYIKERQLNPWNPLSYIILVFLFIGGCIMLIKEEVLPDVIKLFKWR